MRNLIYGLAAVLVVFCCAPASADVEVRFFAEGDLVVGANVSVLSENPAYTGEKLGPSPDGTYLIGTDPGTKVTFYVSNGTQPYTPVTVSIPENLAGTMDIDVVPLQANDLCEGAEAIGLGVTPGSTAGATTDTGTPFCGTGITSPGVWYTVDGTGTVMAASTCNDGNPATGSAGYDSKISVYCEGCDVLTCVAGNDDGPGCAAFSSYVEWCSEVGAEYQVLVHGFGGQSGPFELAILDTGIGCTPTFSCLPPPPTGACCNCLPAPFNCTEGTLDECDLLEGEFQGDDTTCTIVPWDSAPGLTIPDGANTYVWDTITVTDSGVINDVNVAMTITHTWLSDLEIAVDHGGVTLVLWYHQCSSGDNINSTADDTYNSISCAEISEGPLWDIRWPPAIGGLGPLSVYNGMDMMGDWHFGAGDFFPADVGTIDYWALQFNDEPFDTICPEDGATGQHVTICHYPPGNPENARTITIGAPAVDAHVAQHGDTIGPCEGGDLDMQVVEGVADSADESSTFGSR